MTHARDLELADLQAILASTKDAHHVNVEWQRCNAPTGELVAASLMFMVTVNGHHLKTHAEWTGEKEQQIRFGFHGDGANLARMCLTSCHDGVPHWHFLERTGKTKGQKVQLTEDIPDPPTGPDAMDSLLDIYVDRLKIINLVRPMGLFHES